MESSAGWAMSTHIAEGGSFLFCLTKQNAGLFGIPSQIYPETCFTAPSPVKTDT